MTLSLSGLLLAGAMLTVGLVQLLALRRVLERARAGLAPAEAAAKAAMHRKVLGVALALDLTVLPAVGYVAGRAIFD